MRPVTIEDGCVVTHGPATTNSGSASSSASSSPDGNDPIANLRWYLKRVCAPGAPLLHNLASLESRLATAETALADRDRHFLWDDRLRMERELGDLATRLATAEAERAALAADADRLSWLQHIAQVSRYGVAIAPVGATRLALWEPLDGEIPDGWCLARSAFSLRDAIDEGRAQEDARRPPTPGDTP